MAVVSTTLKETTYRKMRYIAKQDLRPTAGFLRHLVVVEIRRFEAEYGEIVLPPAK